LSSKDQLVLKKIQQHIESILRYCQGVRNFQQFQSDSMLVEATVFNLMQIGEPAKVSLSDEAKAQLTAIPWPQLYGMRNRIVHGYAGVNMNIPLYTAGETRAKIRQSKYQKWQAQELVLEAERQAVSDVTSAWELMTSNKAQIKSIKDQVKANEIALDGVQKEEALGNRTILDVLDAYQELLNSNVNEVKARRDYYVAAMQLLLSMGKLTAEDLRLNVDLYNPKKFYKETRDKWLSLSVD